VAIPNVERPACLSVDLDPVRSYLDNRRLAPAPETNLNAVYDDGLPRILGLLSRLRIPATFFAVGEDAQNPPNAARLRAAASSGHEVASHSHRHRPDFHLLDRSELELDIARSREALEDAAGVPVAGFRAPAWNIPQDMFQVLAARGFAYDSSLISRPAGPWRKAALRLLKAISPSMAPHRIMQGQPPVSAIPPRPYPVDCDRPWLQRAGSALWEIPHGCSTGAIPVPLNATVLQWLPWPLAAGLCRAAAGRPEPLIFVCHGLDLVDFERSIRDPRLRGKPGLTAPIEKKERRISRLLALLGTGRAWMTLRDLQAACAASEPPPASGLRGMT